MPCRQGALKSPRRRLFSLRARRTASAGGVGTAAAQQASRPLGREAGVRALEAAPALSVASPGSRALEAVFGSADSGDPDDGSRSSRQSSAVFGSRDSGDPDDGSGRDGRGGFHSPELLYAEGLLSLEEGAWQSDGSDEGFGGVVDFEELLDAVGGEACAAVPPQRLGVRAISSAYLREVGDAALSEAAAARGGAAEAKGSCVARSGAALMTSRLARRVQRVVSAMPFPSYCMSC